MPPICGDNRPQSGLSRESHRMLTGQDSDEEIRHQVLLGNARVAVAREIGDAGFRQHLVVDEEIAAARFRRRSEEHTSELQSLMRISYAVFCLKKKTKTTSQ